MFFSKCAILDGERKGEKRSHTLRRERNGLSGPMLKRLLVTILQARLVCAEQAMRIEFAVWWMFPCQQFSQEVFFGKMPLGVSNRPSISKWTNLRILV